MSKEETNALNLLAHTLVEKIDALGLGPDLMDHLGPAGTRALLDAAGAHEDSQK